MTPKEQATLTFYPESRAAWRQWLADHHDTETAVWMIYHKKKTGKGVINWAEAVEEALCFGWIDSKAKPIDDDRYMQFFSRRKPKSVWSKINKDKVQVLIDAGLMMPAGYASIERAKANGSWSTLDEVEALVIPHDLAKALRAHKGAKAYFESLSRSVKKMMLHWIVMAKRPETRQQRIEEIATAAGRGERPLRYQ